MRGSLSYCKRDHVAMSNEDDVDCCPHCKIPLEIVTVRFRLRGINMIMTCPNCAVASAPGDGAEKTKVAGRVAIPASGYEPVIASMRQVTLRARHVVGFVFAALFTAALLRHGLHMYGGLTREEIRWYTLIALFAVTLAAMLFLRNKRRRAEPLTSVAGARHVRPLKRETVAISRLSSFPVAPSQPRMGRDMLDGHFV